MQTSRRSFFKIAAGFLALAASAKVGAEERRKPKAGGAGGGNPDLSLPWAKPGQGQAGTLKYQEDHAKVEPALQTDRSGVKFKDQHCHNCMFFTAVGKKDGKGAGKCQVLPGVLVNEHSWCNSWAKKA